MAEHPSREAIMGDLVIPDLLQQAFHEVGHISDEHQLFAEEEFSANREGGEDNKSRTFQSIDEGSKICVGLSETPPGLSLDLQNVPSLSATVAVNSAFISSVDNLGTVGANYAGGQSISFVNSRQEAESFAGEGHSFHQIVKGHLVNSSGQAVMQNSILVSREQLAMSNMPAKSGSNHLKEKFQQNLENSRETLGTVNGCQFQGQASAITSSSKTVTIKTEENSSLFTIAAAAPKLGTYHNRNFVQTEANAQSSVYLVPSVQSDGSVTYAFHHSPQVKIVSPLKACQSIIPLVRMPTSAALEGKNKRPVNSKIRPPAMILPKGASPRQHVPRLLTGGKLIRLNAGPQEGGGGPLLAVKQASDSPSNGNTTGIFLGFSGEAAPRMVHCPDGKSSQQTTVLINQPMAVQQPVPQARLHVHSSPKMQQQQQACILPPTMNFQAQKPMAVPVSRSGSWTLGSVGGKAAGGPFAVGEPKSVPVKTDLNEAGHPDRLLMSAPVISRGSVALPPPPRLQAASGQSKPVMNPAISQLSRAAGQEKAAPGDEPRRNSVNSNKARVRENSAEERSETADAGPSYPTKKAENSFSVVAFVREMTARSHKLGKQRARGRPKRGMLKVVNEKKTIAEMKKEHGLKKNVVKELGFIQADTEEDYPEEDDLDSGVEAAGDQPSPVVKLTRCGRHVRPPKRIRKDDKVQEAPKIEERLASFASPPPFRECAAKTGVRRNMSRPDKNFVCQVCGKIYLGKKKMARHLKFYPAHNFASSSQPSAPIDKKWTVNVVETWIAETEAASILDLAGPKLLQSFSLWDLLVKKVSYRGLGTVEILSSLFADIQALVMDLKNLAEQCLTSQRPNSDSFSVTLSPMMSSILGQSRNGGGVERFVLPYNQIPVHYHKLLGFPTGLGHAARPTATLSTTIGADILSPDSTNSIFQPEEDNMSQMSLSSDILDRPLGDKVVLEENLGNRQRSDMDEEETQDSSIAEHHNPDHDDDDDDGDGGGQSPKRARLDFESESSPPHFLHEEESNVSNISSTSNSGPKESHHEDEKSDCSPGKAEHSVDSLAEAMNIGGTVASSEIGLSGPPPPFATAAAESGLARLPSFSSIINGSPKMLSSPVAVEGNGEGGDNSSEQDGSGSSGGQQQQQAQQQNSANLQPAPDSLLMSLPRESGRGQRLLTVTRQQNGDRQLHLNEGHPLVGGSAPGSPHGGGLDYLRGRLDPEKTGSTGGGGSTLMTSFQRRGSLDVNTASVLSRLCEPEKQPSEPIERHSCGTMFVNPDLCDTPAVVDLDPSADEQSLAGDSVKSSQRRRFSFVQEACDPRHKEGNDSASSSSSMPIIVTSPFQNTCDNAVFNVTSSSSILYTSGMPNSSFLDSTPKNHIVAGKTFLGGLNHIYHQDGSTAAHNGTKTVGRSVASLGKVMPGGLQDDSSKRDIFFSDADSDHNQPHHHNQHHQPPQERSPSAFLANNTNKRPSSPVGAARRLPAENMALRSAGHSRHHEFDCSTHVTYSGELYHPIPSVSPAKDSLKEFDCGGKRLRQTPPTSQSPSLFNDLESVLSEEFAFHSALSHHVENVPAKTPEKLLASVPPSVIMNKKCSVGFDNFADQFEEKCPPSEATGTVADLSRGLKNDPSSYVVTCRENLL